MEEHQMLLMSSNFLFKLEHHNIIREPANAIDELYQGVLMNTGEQS